MSVNIQAEYEYDSDDFPDFWYQVLDEAFFDFIGGLDL